MMQAILSHLKAQVYVATSFSSFHVHVHAICVANIHFISSLIVTQFVAKMTLLRSLIGFNTGTGKPAVLPKRVSQVRVRFWFLANRDTPRTRTAVSRVFTGLL